MTSHRYPVQGWARSMAHGMVMAMATRKVTITIEEHLLRWFEQRAAADGAKLSPTIVTAARNWLLWEDAARVADADRLAGLDSVEEAEAELALQREAEQTESGRGHAA